MREKKRETEGEIVWKRRFRKTRKKERHTFRRDRGSNRVTWTHLLEYL